MSQSFLLGLFASAILCLFLFGEINGQEKTFQTQNNISFRTWVGYSKKSVSLLGKTKNSSSLIYGIGVKKLINKQKDYTINYTADVVPYIYYKYPKRDDGDQITETTGFGFSPVGFELEYELSRFIGFISSTSGYFIYIRDTFPTDKGRKLNFAFDISPGFRLKIIEPISVVMGYKFHHISNAQTGEENPGIDSNFLFFTFQIN